MTSRPTGGGQQGSLDDYTEAKVPSLGGFFLRLVWGKSFSPKASLQAPLVRKRAEPLVFLRLLLYSKITWLMAPPLGLSFLPQWRQRSQRCGPRRGLLPSSPAAPQSPARISAFEKEGSFGSIYQTGMHPKLGQQNSHIQGPSQSSVLSPELSVPLKPVACLPCHYAPLGPPFADCFPHPCIP